VKERKPRADILGNFKETLLEKIKELEIEI
jgi:hypothetical protein